MFFGKVYSMRGWYKKALASYYKSKGEERNVEDINMPITDIRNALEYAGLEVDADTIGKMLKIIIIVEKSR
ncbi:MAG: hypothetical protein SPF36_03205 [Lachnospiraceae bacterium]|nr:hypothetical protein [Lachnospiraceae bacterium]MDY5640097.1 hypothetical protein [Lachnospiraceae bacterium]